MTFDMTKGLRVPPLGRKLKLGFVGGGRGGLVGNWHFGGVRLSGQWDVVAGALSSKPQTALVSAKDWSIPPDRAYTSIVDMARIEAARPDGIDAVTICTPNAHHAEAAKVFLSAGIAVIIDKPLTHSLDTSVELAKAAQDSGCFVAVTYPYIHHAMIRQARAMIANGAIGQVRQVLAEYVQDARVGPDDLSNPGTAWRRDPSTVGRTSTTADIGTHTIHLLEHVTGISATEVRADFHICGGPKTLEDTAFVKLRMSDDVPGHLWITQAAAGNYCGLRLRVYGDRGGLEWDQEHPEQLHYAPLDAPQQVFHRGHGGGMLPQAEALSHLPRGHGEALTDAWANLYSEIGISLAAQQAGIHLPQGQVIYTSLEEGLRGMRFIEACANSHEAGGTWVEL